MFRRMFCAGKFAAAKTLYKSRAACYNANMKKVIEASGICCKRCAERVERKLLLLDGVSGAKANVKKGIVFVKFITNFMKKWLVEYVKIVMFLMMSY